MYQNPFTERFLVIAEKPSVARTIAQVLVYEDKKDGYLEGPDGVVSWCFGHLAEYAMPEAYDDRYRKLRHRTVPRSRSPWTSTAGRLTVPPCLIKDLMIPPIRGFKQKS